MGLTKQQLEALNNNSFPNNNAGAITPAILRDYNTSAIANTVNQDVYTTDSASFNSRILAVDDSLVTTASFNAYTQSTNTFTASISTSVGLLQTFSGSQYKADSASFSSRIEAVTGSGGTTNTGSLLVTASFDNGTRNLTFTKGDATTFNVNIPDVSGSTINTGSFITTGSAGQTQAITGSLNVRNITTYGLNPTPSTANTGSGTQLYFLNSDINGGAQPSIYNIEAGWVMSGTGITNGIVTSTAGDDNGLYVDITSGNVVSGSSYIGTGPYAQRLVVSGGVFTDGNGFVSPGGLTVQNQDGTGVQYGGVAINASGVDPANIFSSFAVLGDTSEATMYLALSSYSQEYSVKPVPGFYGGGLYTGQFGSSDTAITFYSSSIQNWKPTQFKAPVQMTGSLSVSGSTNFRELTGSLAAFSASISTRINNVSGSGGAAFPYTGSAIITGSLIVSGNISERGDLFIISPNQTIDFSNVSSSNKGNIIFGVPDYSDGTFQSGSFVISGSNNILFQGNPQNTVGYYSYVSGSFNILGTPINVSTASVNNPQIDSNYINRQVTLNVVSQSLGVPIISSNILFGQGATTFNHQSGSFRFIGNILGGNNIFTSNQNITKGVGVPGITGNSMMGTVTLNHYSSSIGFDRNTTNGLSAPIVDNYVSSSFGAATNGIAVNRNFFIGNTITIHASGSAASATTRTFADNLIGGGRNTISSSYVNSNNAHLISSIVYGEGLIVSASHTSTAVGGTAFFGRYNDTTAGLNSSQNVIFAVGGGTSTSARKTPFYITTGSAVFVSGSLSVTGSSTFSGSLAVSGTINTITISSAGDVTASRFLATSNAGGAPGAFAYSAASSGGVANTFNTALGKDFLDLYQYQGQPYAFNLHLTSDQLNIYSGSQFSFQLQTNGSGQSQFGGATYYALASGSYTSSVGPGSTIPGLNIVGNNNGGFEINDFKAPSVFEKNVYIQQGLYVSQSNGGIPALTINSNGNTSLLVTGSVEITNGSLKVSSINTSVSITGSLSIDPNGEIKLGSGSNTQTGTFVLDGGNPGIATISNNKVNSNSLIFLTKQTNTNSGEGTVSVTSKGSGTFSVTSNHNGDADTVAYMIINPS